MSTTITYSTPGTYTFTPPSGVTSLNVQCWGAGGGGVNDAGHGGGGGEYAAEAALTVTPLNNYTVVVGSGGTGSTNTQAGNGGNSTFNGTGVVAHGGLGAPYGGSPPAGGSGSTNTVHHNGGTGGTGAFTSGDGGAGGGSSAGTSAAGNTGGATSTSSGGAGGTAVTGGGAGGTGGSSTTNGSVGSAPGGGGGGSGFSAPGAGANGAAGQVVVTYTQPAPTISSISPTSGTASGGTSVTITGADLTGATTVSFGGTPAASFTVNSDTQITATSPAGSGSVSVTVTTPEGTSGIETYTYTVVPTLTGLSPTGGPVAGGTSVVLTGTGFSNVSAVTFGSTSASYTVNSSTQITATAPAESAGAESVTVTTLGGTSGSQTYTYFAVPTLSSVSPTSGAVAGGTSVILTGTGLTGATAVAFGANSASFTVNSNTQITATSPAGSAGGVSVTATTPGGTSNAETYTYVSTPSLTGISPVTGAHAGGTTVVITGANLTGATAVTFGSTPATTFTVNSGTQITAVSPAGSGSVSVTVTTPSGTSNGEAYLYDGAPILAGDPPPTWRAAQNATVNQVAGIESNDIDQFLVTHAANIIYQGAPVVSPSGTGASPWALQTSTLDIDQPFTMSGTSIGRVQLPLLPVGNGADLLVSLCANNSGTPGTVINQTRVPAGWIYQQSAIAAVSGPSSSYPIIQVTSNPLAVAQFNSFIGGTQTTTAWSLPSASDGSYIASTWITTPGWLIALGGSSLTTGAVQAGVFTSAIGSTGITPVIAQPSLPTVLTAFGATVQTDTSSGTQTVVVAGGLTSFTGTPVSNVYTASFDPGTGSLSAWSAQTSLPVGLSNFGCVASGDYVYVIAGSNASFVNVATVYYAQVSNGQITQWNATTPLPGPYGLNSQGATVVNNKIYVLFNGFTLYAPINVNGALGNWQYGPAPTQPYFNIFNLSDAGLISPSTGSGAVDDLYCLSDTPDGPDFTWQGQNTTPSLGAFIGVTPTGDGTWQAFNGANLTAGVVNTFEIVQTPRISIPLPTTGLTNGTTYHILIQQQGGDSNNYLRTHTDVDVFPGNPTLLTSPRDAYTWTAATSSTAVPLQIFNQAIPAGNQQPLHTWEDGGARVTTLVYGTTPDQRFLGIADATVTQAGLNANQGFEFGITPWTVGGGTVAQSSTQAYTGTFSAQVTPNGVSSQAFIESELMPCLPGQSISVSGWFWFTSTVTTNTSLSVNWYTNTGTFISTSSSAVSVPATTWENVVNAFTAPATAYQFRLVPTLMGTPAASNIWYVDDVFAYYTTVGEQQSSVVSVEWNGTWPENLLTPLGLTELA